MNSETAIGYIFDSKYGMYDVGNDKNKGKRIIKLRWTLPVEVLMQAGLFLERSNPCF